MNNNNFNTNAANNKSKKLKREKGSRYLVPKLRFSNSVEENYIPFNKRDNYHLPNDGRMKTYRSRHRESIKVNENNLNNYPPYVYNKNIEMQKDRRINNHKKNIFDKLHAKGNLFLTGGVAGKINPLHGKMREHSERNIHTENVGKINPLFEKKLDDLEDKRDDLLKNIEIMNKEKWQKLGEIDFKIKQLAFNGARGLRNSTRKTMNKLNRELRQ
jgi:hypothetical protein